MTMSNAQPGARFSGDGGSIKISELTIDEHDVIQEARRWAGGGRGPVADAEAVASADVTRFVTEAIGLGARAISATGQAQESQALSHLIKDVGDRAAGASTTAAEMTARATKEAATAIQDSAERARKAVAAASREQRKSFTETVVKANTDLLDTVTRMFGGEHPELLARLQPLLEKFGTELDSTVAKQTEELFTKAARQFDPSDPTSPMAKHASSMRKQYDELTKAFAAHFNSVNEKLGSLEKAIAVERAVRSVAKVTPIKGGTYEQEVHEQVRQIAAGLGDEYTATGNTVGAIPRCRKGDGVLTLSGGAARVMLEMTDSSRSGWSEYLDVAERNRDAIASLGLVRTPEQNDNHVVRTLGARRVVMAFDPQTDSPDLLRTAVLLLRTSALAAATRDRRPEIDLVAEKIETACEQLGQLNDIRKAASAIGKNAASIEAECDKVGTTIRRILTEAQTAIEGVPSELDDHVDTIDGAA